jgi:hypothetical protein
MALFVVRPIVVRPNRRFEAGLVVRQAHPLNCETIAGISSRH